MLAYFFPSLTPHLSSLRVPGATPSYSNISTIVVSPHFFVFVPQSCFSPLHPFLLFLPFSLREILFGTSGRVSKMPTLAIENTLGALEIGSSIAVFLFGILTLQTYLYFTRFGKERIQIQALVRRKTVRWLDPNNPFTTGWHSLVKRSPIPFSILFIF